MLSFGFTSFVLLNKKSLDVFGCFHFYLFKAKVRCEREILLSCKAHSLFLEKLVYRSLRN